MTLGIGHLQPIVSLIAGVLILIMPRLLSYIVTRPKNDPSRVRTSRDRPSGLRRSKWRAAALGLAT